MNQSKDNKKGANNQNNLHASRHLLELVRDYVDDEKVQADVVESYNAKKPKPYAHVFNGLFRFSKVTLFAFHSLSFLIATPLIFSLAFQFLLRRDPAEIKTLFDNIVANGFGEMLTPVFIIPATVTLMILLLLEYGQHTTLNGLFNIFFQWGKKIVPGLAILALLFSGASVGTSGLGAKEFVYVSKAPDKTELSALENQLDQALELREKHSDRSNSIIRQRDSEIAHLRMQKAKFLEGHSEQVQGYSKIMIFISLFFEIMIIANTYNIHNYQYKTAKETQMINDLMFGGGSTYRSNAALSHRDYNRMEQGIAMNIGSKNGSNARVNGVNGSSGKQNGQLVNGNKL